MGQQHTVGTVATTVKRNTDGTLVVRYHSTDVVTVYPNGKIVLNTGGYRSATTKTRMNQASRQYGLGFQVFQSKYDWYVEVDGHTLDFEGRELTIRNGSDFDRQVELANEIVSELIAEGN